MIDGGTGGGGGGGGIDMSALAGLASQSWVDNSYISKAFWNELFEIKTKVETIVKDSGGEIISDTTIDGPDLAPNTLPSETSSTDETTGNVTTVKTTIDSIKAKKGLWTDFFLSALGKNASGTGGVLSLNDLVDVDISNPQSGEVLKYNGTKWVNGTGGGGGGGSVTSVSMTVPTGFNISGSPITSSGTLAISFASGYSLPTTAKQTSWDNKQDAISDLTTIRSYATEGHTAYGWGNHANAGYWKSNNHPTTLSGYGITDAYTKTEADAKFMTIAAFENLFNALNSSGQKVNHPYSSAVASIKALFGLWTDQYLSALGNNSSGGGTILAEPLASINTANLGMPTASGQVITWNGTQWIYSIPSGGGGGTGTVTSITAGTGLSGGTITTMGTIAINSTYQSYIAHGETAYGWGNHANAGYLTGITATMINNALGFTLSGTSGTTYNLATIASNASHGETAYELRHSHTNKTVLDGITSAKVSSWDLVAGASWWGQSLPSNGAVTGSLSSVVNITMSGELYMQGGKHIYFKSGNSYLNAFEFDNTQLAIGYGFRTTNELQLYGSEIVLIANGVEKARATAKGLQIGDAVIVWDSTNNALKITKYSGNSEVACNLYATGGVSALGLSTGGSIDNLNVTTSIKMNPNARIYQEITTENRYLYIGRSDNAGWVGLADMCSQSGPEKWYIYAATGEAYFMTSVRSARFYLDLSRYLCLDGSNNLMFYNGSTLKQVAFVN